MKEPEILQTLVELQKVDRAILDVEHEKTALKEEIKGFKDRIAAKRGESASKKSKFEETRKKRVSIEMEIKTKEAEIKTKDGQSAGIKTNEAFKALQREIDSVKSDIKKLEDAIIVFMEEEEAASALFKTQEKEDKEEENVLIGRVKELEEQEKQGTRACLDNRKCRWLRRVRRLQIYGKAADGHRIKKKHRYKDL